MSIPTFCKFFTSGFNPDSVAEAVFDPKAVIYFEFKLVAESASGSTDSVFGVGIDDEYGVGIDDVFGVGIDDVFGVGIDDVFGVGIDDVFGVGIDDVFGVGIEEEEVSDELEFEEDELSVEVFKDGVFWVVEVEGVGLEVSVLGVGEGILGEGVGVGFPLDAVGIGISIDAMGVEIPGEVGTGIPRIGVVILGVVFMLVFGVGEGLLLIVGDTISSSSKEILKIIIYKYFYYENIKRHYLDFL